MQLALSSLGDGSIPALSEGFGKALAESAAVCLEDQGHQIQVGLLVQGSIDGAYDLLRSDVTLKMRRCWNDEERATEHGAYGVAILLIMYVTALPSIETSRKGTGFDFWFGQEDGLLFQRKARLEVSGIRKGDKKAVTGRMRQKLQQMDKLPLSLPGYAAIVEFSRPLVQVASK